MEYSPILAPVVALIAWSLVVMVWMADQVRHDEAVQVWRPML